MGFFQGLLDNWDTQLTAVWFNQEGDRVKHSYTTDINLKLTSCFAPAHTRTFRGIVCTVDNSSFRMTLGFSSDKELGGMNSGGI